MTEASSESVLWLGEMLPPLLQLHEPQGSSTYCRRRRSIAGTMAHTGAFNANPILHSSAALPNPRMGPVHPFVSPLLASYAGSRSRVRCEDSQSKSTRHEIAETFRS